jgi:hypothetical protein
MKTNVTLSLDTDIVIALDAFRAPFKVGRSAAVETLLSSALAVAEADRGPLPEEVFFDEAEVQPVEEEVTGTHFDNRGFEVSPTPEPVPPSLPPVLVESADPTSPLSTGKASGKGSHGRRH